jgi:ribosomal protein L11 methyltransferase
MSNLPPTTFELVISFSKTGEGAYQLKEEVLAVLDELGVDSYVEGSIDGLDIDYVHDRPETEYFADHGGPLSPISVYKFDREYLEQLHSVLAKRFSHSLQISLKQMDTAAWTEGWKESFKPITTQRFYVYPPWDNSSQPENLLPIIMEPGMAFGTGQHATTKLCLGAIENWSFNLATEALARSKVLDVGCGTGILTIAAKKLGVGEAIGTDIDIDAVTASFNNAAMNGCQIEFMQGSVPESLQNQSWDLVIANIIMTVLRQILDDLQRCLASDGVLILSGLLTTDGEEMLELCSQRGLKLIERREMDGWISLTLRRQQ